jgi:biotin transport system substrate-specific component
MSHYRASTPVDASAAAAGQGVSRWAARGVGAGAVLFAAVLTGAAAQISVLVPGTPVPFTLQPLAVLLAGAALGARLGAASQILYLALGVIGASMFAVSPLLAPGVARLAGPTGGFLLAFPAAAFTVGRLADRGWTRSWLGAVAAMGAGLAVLYAAGAAWLGAIAGSAGVVALWPFAAADLLKIAAAAAALPLATRTFGPRP